MSQYKEFQGKSLDDAIKEACDYYGVTRGKLEIDIISDAKTGIFGLVGAKKATIRARRANIEDKLGAVADAEAPAAKRGGRGQKKRGGQADAEARATQTPADEASLPEASVKSAPVKDAPVKDASGKGASAREAQANETAEVRNEETPNHDAQAAKDLPARDRRDKAAASGARRGENGRRGKNAGAAARGGSADKRPPRQEEANKKNTPQREARADDSEVAPIKEDLPDLDLETCDRERLFAVAREVALKLASPIVGSVPCAVSISGRRVRAVLECGEAAGLLVGREGQTLASVQYLASRIVSRIMGASVYMQVDAGGYRERQEDKLKELALVLADKVRQTGKTQSTRPLSAYQRRIVHLALEGDESVLTKSSGDGAQRRVVFYPNKNASKQETEQDGADHNSDE